MVAPATDQALYESVTRFLHCTQCIREKPPNQSPAEWARVNVGLTPDGLLLWCVRHEMKIAFVTYEEFNELAKRLTDSPCGHCGEQEPG